jgi:hypothetical protein
LTRKCPDLLTNHHLNKAYETEKNLTKAKDAAESYAKDRKDEIMRGIDKADQKIETEAAKAKGWFTTSGNK